MNILFQTAHPLAPFRVAAAQRFLSDNRRELFFVKLAALVANGVSLQQSLEDLRRRARGKYGNWMEESLIEDVLLRGVRRGISFAEAMRPWAPSDEIMILQSHAASGLDAPLLRCEKLIQTKAKLKGHTMKSLAYPFYLASLIVVFAFFMGRQILPKFMLLADPASWTGAGRFLFYFTSFINSPWVWFGLIFLVALVGLVFWSFPRWTGSVRQGFDRIPPWSIYKLLVGTSWMFSMSALISAGIPILDALEEILKIAKEDNPWLAERLEAARHYMSGGASFGRALEMSGYEFPDRDTIANLVIFSDLHNFEETLQKTAEMWLAQGIRKIEAQTLMLNIVMTAIMAVMWLLIAGGTYSIIGKIVTGTLSTHN